jgi:hypothetical protein
MPADRGDLMNLIRAVIYKIGIRPKPGSIFYSPSRALLLAVDKAWKDSGL